MKILLTGAAGFLGKACETTLRETGHVLVTTDIRGDVDYQGDLTDPRFVVSLPDVDAVVHTAAVQYVSADLPLWRRSSYFARNNIEATRQIVNRYTCKGVHFINIGTSMMYKQCGASRYAPESVMEGQGAYSRSKLAAQQAVEQAFSDWATVVPCIIGGEGREGLFRNFVQSIRRRGSVFFPGEGIHPISMVHVDDVATLIELVVRKHASGFYNSAAPEPLTITQWIEEIAHELNIDDVIIHHIPLAPVNLASVMSGYRLLAREQLLMLAQSHVLDITRSEKLGWTPQRNNAEIIRDIARYIVTN